MTIKELEFLVGMTRANIRFYEQEGLLSPARRENGYRDYSEADADALRKIKLLRQLHLDLEAIRALQSGERELGPTLAAQLAELERDQAALDRAREVCRALRESGASYAALDPKPWLAELERAPMPQSGRFPPPSDVRPPDSVRHPWRRFLARRLDYLLCHLIWFAVYTLVLRWDLQESFLGQLFSSYVCWGLVLLLEPLLLHLWATTPGKLLFGISIRDGAGRKLTYRAALSRTWMVFAKGMGYNIMFYELWRLWKSYKLCREEERQPWEADETYTFSDGKNWRCAAFVGANGVCLALIALILLQSSMPPNRGGLTAAEYYENCNFYMDYLELDCGRLTQTGTWEEESPPVGVVLTLFDAEYTYDLTLTGGVVTGVTLTYEASGDSFLYLSSGQQQAALLAFAAARPGVRPSELADWAEIAAQRQWDFDVVHEGLRITRETKLTHAGHSMSDTFIIPVDEGETGTVTQIFQITLEETP